MAKPVETVHERDERKKRELGFSENQRLRLHKEKRRLRRQNLKPRLSFAEDAEGWVLTLPTSRLTIRRLFIWALALLASLALAYRESKDDFVGPILIIAMLSLPFAYMLYAYVAEALQNPLVRFHVARDGEFSVRARRRVLHRGPKAQCTVGINYARSNSLAVLWLPGDTQVDDLGDRDLEILRSFCDPAGVPIAAKVAKGANARAEDSDADGFEKHDDYVRQKWAKRVMVLLGLGVLASVAWQELSHRKAPGHNEPPGSTSSGPPH